MKNLQSYLLLHLAASHSYPLYIMFNQAFSKLALVP